MSAFLFSTDDSLIKSFFASTKEDSSKGKIINFLFSRFPTNIPESTVAVAWLSVMQLNTCPKPKVEGDHVTGLVHFNRKSGVAFDFRGIALVIFPFYQHRCARTLRMVGDFIHLSRSWTRLDRILT
jgi:hypothetical protein